MAPSYERWRSAARGSDAGRFWDERARENALFFVDDRVDPRDPDVEAFWAEGERDLDTLLAELDLAVGPEDRVVEIGCGVGRLTRVLAARAREVVALDVSGEMLNRARELVGEPVNVRWRQNDGRSLAGVDDATADACVSHVVFQHIPEPAVTLHYVAEMGRVLRPGGWAAFVLSNDPEVHRRRREVSLRRGPRGRTDPHWLGAAVSLEALHATATAAGLELERIVNPGTQFCAVRARRS